MRRLASIALLVATLALTSSQLVTRDDVVTGVGLGTFAWSGAPPSGWTGSKLIVTKGDFTTYVQNTGSCGGAGGSTGAMTYGNMTSCAIVATPHSPILANNTFLSGSYSSWSSSGSACTTGTTAFAGVNSTGQDGIGYAGGASGTTCTDGGSGTATLKASQTFTISGTPTSQTFSFWYYADQVSQGGAGGCSRDIGTLTGIRLKINGTTVVSDTTPTIDSTWHEESGSTSALTSGSNTLTVETDVEGASLGTDYVVGPNDCEPSTDPIASQNIQIDHFVLTATY